MLYLLLAILSSATIAIVMRLSSNKVTSGNTMLATNYLVCLVLATLFGDFQLLPLADIVACAMPGTAATRGLLHKDRLLAMKPTALLLNCGRGSLIPTKDLEEVLAAGHLGGVALDVTDPEPLPADSPLWDCSRVILTPHISGASFGHVAATEDKIYALAAENLRRYLASEPLLNEVDFQTGYRKR
jgi:phosphoglycerate dehydrogenase-like enzyme